MKFTQQVFEISTSINKDAPSIKTVLALTESDIDIDVVISTLMSGQSPRVRLQNRLRDNGIPKELTISWAEFLTPGKTVRVAVKQTDEEIAQGLLSDPVRLKAMLGKLGLTTEESV